MESFDNRFTSQVDFKSLSLYYLRLQITSQEVLSLNFKPKQQYIVTPILEKPYISVSINPENIRFLHFTNGGHTRSR